MKYHSKIQMVFLITFFVSSFVWIAYKTTDSKTVYENMKCQRKVTKVAFLKVHKAGSTSVSNILQRFALRHRLNLLLPDKPQVGMMFHVIGRDYEDVIPPPFGQSYDILCNHVRYNRKQFHRWFNKDTRYIAIVRDPTERFLSSTYYYGFMAKYKRQNHLTNSVMEGKLIEQQLRKKVERSDLSAELLNMAVDFGIAVTNQTVDYVKQYMEIIKHDFSLVLLLEYFDESLILMKRKFCWDLQDIIYMKRNENALKNTMSLTTEARKLLQNLQKADEIIYRHYKKQFFTQLHLEGPRFFDEVLNFKTILRRTSIFCESTSLDTLSVEATRWNSGFEITRAQCIFMNKDEISLNRKLIKRQWKRYDESLPPNAFNSEQ